MLIELLQLWKILTEGIFYYLPIHLILFVILPLILREVYSRNYKEYSSLKMEDVKISVVVPEYGEDTGVFKKCLESISDNKVDEIIVVHDDCRNEIAELAKQYGAQVYSFSKRVGKRRALVEGWRLAKGDIIIHVDSDCILEKNAVNEIIKPFDDEQVVGVQGKSRPFQTGSWFAWRLSQVIEYNRDVNNKALNGHLVVVDGRFNAWKRFFLLSYVDDFLNERFLGNICEQVVLLPKVEVLKLLE